MSVEAITELEILIIKVFSVFLFLGRSLFYPIEKFILNILEYLGTKIKKENVCVQMKDNKLPFFVLILKFFK